MLTLAGALCGVQGGAQAATRNVPGTYATIQAAVAAASAGDTILVAPGTYSGAGNVDTALGGKDLTIMSSGNATNTIIDCQGSAAASHRAFNFNGAVTAAFVIQGFTIQNGYFANGGAVSINAATTPRPSPTFQKCVFKNNTTTASGGAIFVNAGSVTFSQCDFIGNKASQYGGAAGFEISDAGAHSANFTNCVFAANQCVTDGGALDFATSSTLTTSVVNCSFYGNSSSAANSGTLSFFKANSTIKNCILWNESPKAISSTDPPTAGGGTPTTFTNCDIGQATFGGTQTNVINADPKYVDPANGNLHLQGTSPCLEAGTSAGAPTTDHDDLPWTGIVSIGAFDGTGVVAPSVTTETATAVTSTGATLNGTINANGGSAAVTFDYGTAAPAYGTNVAGTPSPATGSSPTSVSATIGGLDPHTVYHYRVNGGSTNGGDQTFTTLNTAPTATVSLDPTAPLTNQTLTATATKGDADGDTVTLTYVWKKTVGSTTTTIKTTANSSSLTDTLNLATTGNGDKGDIITVEVTPNDTRNDGSLANASVTINNSAPVANADTATTDAGVAKDITLSANDADTDVLTYTIVDGPTHGSLGAVTGNQVNYTPANGYQGDDSFTFKANDGTVDGNVATISITVNETPSLVVTTTQDVAANDGLTSLREAINAANANADASVVTFASPLFDSAQTIQLASGLPPITAATTITGPGANLLTIIGSGTNADDILTVSSGVSGAFSGLSFDNGAKAIYANGGTVTATNCTFSHQSLALYNKGTVTATDCTFSNNAYALIDGTGAVTTTASGCVFSGNLAGINSTVGSVDATNCTFSSNTTGIDNGGGTVTATNCTISGNGTGINRSSGTVTLKNSIVAGNTTNISGTVSSGADSITTGTAADAGLDPAGLQDNGGPTKTIALLSGSVAVNAANDAFAPATDQRGIARPQGAHSDIGAFEAVGLVIGNATVTEGNSGLKDVTLTVTLSAPLDREVSVQYATGSTGSNVATADVDYVALAPTALTFAAGETSKEITVQVKGDVLSESLERFAVNLTSPTNAVLFDGEGIVTINDDDALPALSVNDVTVTEGNSGTTPATFTVSLSAASGQPVTVKYATGTPSSNAATAGDDYVAVPLTTLTFAPGETTKTVTVLVNGDTVIEGNERFTLTLSAATKATIADKEGLGTIAEDDTGLTINNVTVAEGNSGTTSVVFTVTLSTASAKTVTVKYATGALSSVPATAGSDYVATNGTLTFSPGQTSKTITVQVNGDTLDEVNERFAVNLTEAVNAALYDGEGIATITDDDATPSLVINDVTQAEGTGGTTDFTFTVTLSAASGQNVTVKAATTVPTSNPATAGVDYTALPLTTLTFAPGETTKTVTVVVNADATVEANEKFSVKLSSASNATIADSEGFGTIVNDDAPTLLFEDEPSR